MNNVLELNVGDCFENGSVGNFLGVDKEEQPTVSLSSLKYLMKIVNIENDGHIEVTREFINVSDNSHIITLENKILNKVAIILYTNLGKLVPCNELNVETEIETASDYFDQSDEESQEENNIDDLDNLDDEISRLLEENKQKVDNDIALGESDIDDENNLDEIEDNVNDIIDDNIVEDEESQEENNIDDLDNLDDEISRLLEENQQKVDNDIALGESDIDDENNLDEIEDNVNDIIDDNIVEDKESQEAIKENCIIIIEGEEIDFTSLYTYEDAKIKLEDIIKSNNILTNAYILEVKSKCTTSININWTNN